MLGGTKGVIWVDRETALAETAVRERMLPVDVVLDVGTGIRPQRLLDAYVNVCIEPHPPYVERLREEIADDSRYVLLQTTWDVGMALLPSKSVDTVTALDFIEHLPKEEGQRFLAEAERVARIQIVVFTPLGFYQQSYDDDRADRWGMDGGYWQTHRSGWQPEDFDGDWEILCCRDFHLVDEHDEPLQEPFGALWAIRSLMSV